MLVNQHFQKSFCKYGEDACKQLDVCLSNSSLVMYKNQLILQKLSVLWKPIPSQCRSHIRLTQIKVQSGSEHCHTWNISPREKKLSVVVASTRRRDTFRRSSLALTVRPSAAGRSSSSVDGARFQFRPRVVTATGYRGRRLIVYSRLIREVGQLI